MSNKRDLNNILSTNRKTLYIILSIVMVSILTLTVVYAALSTTLNINGNAEVTAASWDIYLDNIQLNSQSATTNVPTISNKTTASFSTTLSKPGDFYEFTIDVVNNGSIDAMINSVTKTPELTDVQKKYLNYIVEYQNGESITTKQLVSKKSLVRLKVKVEFRKDLTASDLPTQAETLDLAFTINYIQSDDSSEIVKVNNNGKIPKIISGDLETVGSEVAIGDEHFFIISNTAGEIAMLSKYNLHVGNVTINWRSKPLENPTMIQNSIAIGYDGDGGTIESPNIGTVGFSTTDYWVANSALKSEYGATFPAYVYDANSIVYNYVENYKTYLESQGAEIEEARLITYDELITLGCSGSSCKSAPEWIYTSTYWTGSASDISDVWNVRYNGVLDNNPFGPAINFGVRPVIIIKS